jgi:hypothetical protein
MDKSVQYNGQINVAIVVDARIEPVKEKNGRVVVHVQKRKLPPLFPQDDKDGIPKVPNFGNVKEPQQIGRGRNFSTLDGLVHVAGHERVVVAVRNHARLNRHVRTQHNLRNIVHELDGVQTQTGQTQAHNATANQDKEQVGQRNVKGRWKIRQGPSLYKEKKQTKAHDFERVGCIHQ